MVEVILHWLGEQVSWPWAVGGAFLLLTLGKTGYVQRLLVGHSQERITERTRLSEDTNRLIESLVLERDRERKYRLDDVLFYQNEITGLRRELDQREDMIQAKDKIIANLSEAAISSERGNARLRHGLNGSFQYISALRYMMKRQGVELVPFDGWRDLLGITPDLDTHLRALFENADVPLPPPPENPR